MKIINCLLVATIENNNSAEIPMTILIIIIWSLIIFTIYKVVKMYKSDKLHKVQLLEEQNKLLQELINKEKNTPPYN